MEVGIRQSNEAARCKAAGLGTWIIATMHRVNAGRYLVGRRRANRRTGEPLFKEWGTSLNSLSGSYRPRTPGKTGGRMMPSATRLVTGVNDCTWTGFIVTLRVRLPPSLIPYRMMRIIMGPCPIQHGYSKEFFS